MNEKNLVEQVASVAEVATPVLKKNGLLKG